MALGYPRLFCFVCLFVWWYKTWIVKPLGRFHFALFVCLFGDINLNSKTPGTLTPASQGFYYSGFISPNKQTNTKQTNKSGTLPPASQGFYYSGFISPNKQTNTNKQTKASGGLLFRFYITKQTNKQSKTVLGSQEPLVDRVISGVSLFGFYFINFWLVRLATKKTNKQIPRLKPYKMTAMVWDQVQRFPGDLP